MGIHSYYGKFIKNINERFRGSGKKVIQKTLPPEVAGIIFDLNGLIHPVTQEVFKEENANFEVAFKKIITELIRRIENVIKEAKPSQYVILAFDGMPPAAKIYQQQQRRILSYYAEKEQAPLLLFDIDAILNENSGIPKATEADKYIKAFLNANIESLILPEVIEIANPLNPEEIEDMILKLSENI